MSKCEHGWTDEQGCDLCEPERVIAERNELRSRLDTIRQDTIQECWDAINKHIPRGVLASIYENESRNGMVLATNILFALRRDAPAMASGAPDKFVQAFSGESGARSEAASVVERRGFKSVSLEEMQQEYGTDRAASEIKVDKV